MCDTTVTIGDDGVMFAKNSDRDGNESQALEWHPAARSSTTRLDCTWATIDQVAETHAVLLSRPWWMWGAEIGANEHGVVIGNEAVFTDQPYDDHGLLGMDLLRLALERSSTAEQAVATIVGLLEQHGQGGSCSRMRPDFTYHNAFIVADPQGAIVLETAGRRWATETVAAGTARSISNGLTIAGFADAHADRARGRRNACAIRRAITEDGARGARGPLDLMRTLRSHGTGEHPHYAKVSGGMQAPCVHSGGAEKWTDTTASWVADLRGGDTVHWVTATAAPCTSVFKPVRIDEPLDLGPVGEDRFDPASSWWRHEVLRRSIERDPAAAMKVFADERDALESAWVATPPSGADAFAAVAAAEQRWATAIAALGATDRDRRPPFVRTPRDDLDALAGVPSLPAHVAAGGER